MERKKHAAVHAMIEKFDDRDNRLDRIKFQSNQI